jgi:hypothetical protein
MTTMLYRTNFFRSIEAIELRQCEEFLAAKSLKVEDQRWKRTRIFTGRDLPVNKGGNCRQGKDRRNNIAKLEWSGTKMDDEAAIAGEEEAGYHNEIDSVEEEVVADERERTKSVNHVLICITRYRQQGRPKRGAMPTMYEPDLVASGPLKETALQSLSKIFTSLGD